MNNHKEISPAKSIAPERCGAVSIAVPLSNSKVGNFVMIKIKYQKGEKINNCIYLGDIESSDKDRNAVFECKCGKIFIARLANVKQRNTSSCGCAIGKRVKGTHIKHGMWGTKIYNVWIAMRKRCYSKSNISYKNYGGRGITVCDEWLVDFLKFYNYVSVLEHYGEQGYSIDRIDNDGNYEPGNVRWADWITQNNNKRPKYLYIH